jgi:CheY-like chemotaxis protein
VPLRVLIVDDNRDAADSLGQVFGLYGAEVRVAYSGADALTRVADFRPHAGLFDIDMPGMTGLELARRMRDRQADGPLLLIAVTGRDSGATRDRTGAAGFDLHVAKPPDPADLARVVWAFLREKYPGEPP